MAEIAEKLGASGHPAVKSRAGEIVNHVLPKIASDPEWKSPQSRFITAADRSQYAGFEAVSIMLPKITFAGTSRTELMAEMKWPNDTYRAKVEGKD